MSHLSSPHFHSEEAAFVEARVWPNGATCPKCGERERVSKMQGKSTRVGAYKCYACRKPFTVKIGTIFEASHVPMNVWLQAIYLRVGSKKGISSNQLHRTLGVTLKTAWFMSHRIRDPFTDGVTIRGTVEFPVTLGGLPGHQSLTALYSTWPGTDYETVGDFIPPFPPGTPGVKDERYYFNYAFDQQIYQSASNPEKVLGAFGQLSVSDGNPTTIYWSALGGVSGTGIVPGRPADDFGLGVYYTALSSSLKDALPPVVPLRNEWGTEAYYDFALSPSASLGFDLQVIEPGRAESTAVFLGTRLVLTF